MSCCSYFILGKRVIIFINDLFLEKLNDPELSSTFIDGTFNISPKFIIQVWILRGFISDVCFPLAYCLLEDKHHLSYQQCLTEISRAAPLFNPSSVMLDFETAEHKAIRQVFPNCTIKGCLFHWKQAVSRRLLKINSYTSNNVMRADLNTVYGLAFLPTDHVLATWDDLKQLFRLLYPQETEIFITYFELIHEVLFVSANEL